jgi:hypothetical protein
VCVLIRGSEFTVQLRLTLVYSPLEYEQLFMILLSGIESTRSSVGFTFSRKSIIPLLVTTIMKADWVNRSTTVASAALASNIYSVRLPGCIAKTATSIPERACTSSS